MTASVTVNITLERIGGPADEEAYWTGRAKLVEEGGAGELELEQARADSPGEVLEELGAALDDREADAITQAIRLRDRIEEEGNGQWRT